jgi:hypothetical protein
MNVLLFVNCIALWVTHGLQFAVGWVLIVLNMIPASEDWSLIVHFTLMEFD